MTVRSKKQDAETLRILEREKQALHLRKAGASYRAIGEQLGVSHIQARTDVEHALSYIRDDVAIDAARLRDLEVARLDDMFMKLQPHLQSKSERTWDRAYGRAINIIELRSKLQGLFAPVKIQTLNWKDELLADIAAKKITTDEQIRFVCGYVESDIAEIYQRLRLQGLALPANVGSISEATITVSEE